MIVPDDGPHGELLSRQGRPKRRGGLLGPSQDRREPTQRGWERLVVVACAIGLLFAGVQCSPQREAQKDNVVLQWNNAALDAVRSSTIGPPMVSRALAIMHTCMYDAWAAYDRLAVGTSFGSRLRQHRGPPPRPTRTRRSASRPMALPWTSSPPPAPPSSIRS